MRSLLLMLVACGAPPNHPEVACRAAGHYDGTVTSQQAGTLAVTLELRCERERYRGELVTPVGTFEVPTATWHGGQLALELDGGGSVRLAAEGARLHGTFALGGDSGPVELVRHGDAHAPGGEAETLDLPAAKWREDVQYFAREVAAQHANAFYHTPRADFDAAIARLERDLDHMTGDAIYVALDRIANAIGDGHTYVQTPDDRAMVPLDIARFGSEYRIEGVLAGNEAALGQVITAIEGVPIDRVVAALRTLTPAAETPMLGDIRIEDFLGFGALLHGLGLVADRAALAYTLGDGSVIHVRGVPAHELEHAAWIHPFREQPPYLRHRERGLECEPMDKALYCVFKNYDNLEANARDMFATVERDHPAKLVIDMRYNLGGDYHVGEQALIAPLRDMPKGQLFVLIGPYTFSAGMSNAAQFRTETHAILVGQTIGERPNSYQEARTFTLPNSHLSVRVSTKLYHFSDAPENELRPDRAIARTWDDYAAGRDAVLDWVLAY